MAELRYLDDAGHLCVRSLDAEQFVIGRTDKCSLTFPDDMVSREHATIELQREGRFRIRDLGSRNKTYINGELSGETLLNHGDIIRIGDHVLEFLDDTGSAEKIDLEFLTPDRTEPADCDWHKIKAPISLTIAQVEQLSLLSGGDALTARAEDVAHTALGRILLDVQAERGFVALRGDSKTELKPIAHRALKRPAGGSLTPVSQSFVLAPVLQQVAGRYPQSAGKVDLKQGYAATAIVAPLTWKGDVIGVLYVDRPSSRKPFPAAALPYLCAAGANLGAAVAESSRRLARNAARESAAWMTTIRRLQHSLSVAPQGGDGFEVASERFAGRVRCGDFADVVHLDEQRCCALVVDGGGHGTPGIAQASALRAAFRAALASSEDSVLDASAAVAALNEWVARMPGRQVMPCTWVGIDMAAGKLAYINAGGMPPLLMVGAGRLVTLDQPSLVLGVDAEYVYQPTRVDVPEKFRLICCTDGLIEATGAGGEALGDQRLHEALLDQDAFGSADDVLHRVVDTWKTHLSGAHPDDDAQILIIARG